MRLNRVLLLAATISLMMFALVFTISCSGDDGKNGKNGKGCTAEPNGNGGYNVTCDGEYMGILEGTADHKGKPGTDGTPGKNGSWCVVGNQTATSIEIKCNGESAGTLDACEVKGLSDRELQITCKSAEIHICKDDAGLSEVFNAAKKQCDPATGILTTIGTSSNIQCQGDKKPVSAISNYCGYANEKATKRTALPRCHYSLDTLQPNIGIDVSNTYRYGDALKCTNAGGDLSTIPYGGTGYWGGHNDGDYYNACYLNLRVRYGQEGDLDYYIDEVHTCLEAGGDTLSLQYRTGSVRFNPTVASDYVTYPNLIDVFKGTIDAGGTVRDAKGDVVGSLDYNALGNVVTAGTGAYYSALTNEVGGLAFREDNGKVYMYEEAAFYDASYGHDYICVSPWQNQYCKYISPRIAVAPKVSSALCGGRGGARWNEGSWKGEYCGYLEKVNNKGFFQSVQKGLCDDWDDDATHPDHKRGPNEDYFNAGYCTVLPDDRVTGKTTYVDEYDDRIGNGNVLIGNFCGSGSKNKPNNGKWNKEYCGFVWKNDNSTPPQLVASAEKEKVYSDICDDKDGPMSFNDTKYAYCEVKFENRLNGFTTRTGLLCGATGQPNKNSWLRQYCGYKNDKSDAPDKVYTGICDDGYGPSENGYNKAEYCQAKGDSTTVLSTFTCDIGSDSKINVDVWKGEYCGYASLDAAGTSKLTGACGDAEDKGPNSDVFGGGYCTAIDKKGHMEYSTAFCGPDSTKVNEGSWKGEYCGFESETSLRPDKIYTGVCDNGGGPNEGGFNAGYCRMNEESSTETEFTDVLCGGATMNEGEWKGEFCYADDKVAVCTGGRIPNLDKKSTDPFSVRCTFTVDELICSDSNLGFCDKDGCADLGENYKWDEENNECLAIAETI